jgi:hypothetical protein
VYAARQIVLVFKSTGGLLYAGHPTVRSRIYGDGTKATEVPSQLVRLRTKARERAA